MHKKQKILTGLRVFSELYARANGTAITHLEELHYYPFGMLMEGLGATAGVSGEKEREIAEVWF